MQTTFWPACRLFRAPDTRPTAGLTPPLYESRLSLCSSRSRSNALNDVTVSASADGQSAQKTLTVRAPYRLNFIPAQTQTACDSTWGYMTHVYYAVLDQFSATLPTTVSVNEKWTSSIVKDLSTTNWRRGSAGGSTTNSAAVFRDAIGGEHVNLPPVPVPTCNGNSTPIEHWGQEWYVGSQTPGSGTRVQGNTLEKRRGFAQHTSVSSP